MSFKFQVPSSRLPSPPDLKPETWNLKPGTGMDTLKTHAVEVIAAVWLVIVAVQYLSRYFIRWLDLDFTCAYIGMLVLITMTMIARILKKEE